MAEKQALDSRAEIYGLRAGQHAKAYPVERILREKVVNDRLGEMELVLVGDPESGTVRAYHRDGRTFVPGRDGRELRDTAGGEWRITEEALLPKTESSPRLDRVPGHLSLWFAWYGFFPQTEVYGAAPER